jgi:hypothetical protein
MTTTTRPVPTTMQVLREHWMPEEPESTVTACRAGVSRLDVLIRGAVTRLDEHDRQVRKRIMALAEAAIAGEDLDRHQLALVSGERPVLVEALDELRSARAVVVQRIVTAEQTDPIHVDWARRCRQIADEWDRARWGEDKTTAMLEFMQRHTPS